MKKRNSSREGKREAVIDVPRKAGNLGLTLTAVAVTGASLYGWQNTANALHDLAVKHLSHIPLIGARVLANGVLEALGRGSDGLRELLFGAQPHTPDRPPPLSQQEIAELMGSLRERGRAANLKDVIRTIRRGKSTLTVGITTVLSVVLFLVGHERVSSDDEDLDNVIEFYKGFSLKALYAEMRKQPWTAPAYIPFTILVGLVTKVMSASGASTDSALDATANAADFYLTWEVLVHLLRWYGLSPVRQAALGLAWLVEVASDDEHRK